MSVARAHSPIEDLDASYQFLVTHRSTHGGAVYALNEGSLKGVALPLSFYDTDRYWGAYVCALPDANCSVKDYYDPHDYTLKPRNAEPGASLQAERVNVHNGSNIYDAATWQIAVMLGAVVNRFGNSLGIDAYGLAAGQNRLLGQIHESPGVTLAKRATTSGSQFKSAADSAANPHLVSVENNFSLYAGLKILQATLRAELTADGTLDTPATRRIERALAISHVMISGGDLPAGRTTLGMERFFRDCAWHDGEFVQGGLANDPAASGAWIPVLEPKAVDVNTWGIAALGAAQVDRWFGFGSAYRVWKGLESWGSYGNNQTLWGVGYSDRDGNGQDAAGHYRQGVLSAESTAGAITMVRNMIEHYHSTPEESVNHAIARQYEKDLREDERTMLQRIQALRLDRYAVTEFPGKPEHYSDLITGQTKPYLYASRRYRIPFGWNANPIPSTASTAWVIMIADEYDPFGYAGKPN